MLEQFTLFPSLSSKVACLRPLSHLKQMHRLDFPPQHQGGEASVLQGSNSTVTFLILELSKSCLWPWKA